MVRIFGRLFAILAMVAATHAVAGPRATTKAGVVEGASEGGVSIFRGIPFAAAPTGANRWRAPQPFPRWQGVRQATQFGHSCWQAVSPQGFGPWSHEYVVQGDISEDCLFLNVWAPEKRAGKLPVLVWIHGGGFNSGSGAIPIYDGRALASQGAIVVTINYRVGVFGFLAHPELTREAGKGPNGNFGLQDAVAALQWVRDNIAAFGGNPEKRAGKLPVLVWIHGGGFNSGSGAIPIYDGRALASQGAIVVTINYRVGVFGFLAHPELTKEAGSGPNGNFGLQDTVAALKWVRDNIAAFGGDPNAVTIAGQSAGSSAVHQLVASPLAKGLFARAIGESGLPRPIATLAVAEQQGVSFAQEKNAANLAALRALPADALQPPTGANAVRFVPMADGVLLPHTDGRPVSDVPMLVGFTADEASSSRADYGSPDPAKLQAMIADAFGANAAQAASLYPAATDQERSASNRQIRRDRNMAGILDWAKRRSASASAPVFAYSFDHVMPGTGTGEWGAFHSSEIPYVFQTFAASPERNFTDRDRQLSATMSAYWLAFVRSGNPNGQGRPQWPTLDTERPQVLRFGSSVGAAPLLPSAKLAAFARP